MGRRRETPPRGPQRVATRWSDADVAEPAALLRAVAKAGARLMQARSVASVGAAAVEELQRLLGADHVALHLLSPEGRVLLLETFVPPEDFPLMLEGGQTFLPAVMEQASSVALPDMTASRWAAGEPHLVEAGIRSVLAVPVRGQGGLIGCATLLYRRLRPFALWETGAVEALLLQAGAVIERCRATDGGVEHQALLERLHTAHEQTFSVLAQAMQARDRYTAERARRSADLAAAVAESARLDPDLVRRIRYAALLRDVGYLAIPDAVLLKAGELTADEWQMVQAHPIIGGRLIDAVDWLRDAVPIVSAHHERVDGSGYPFGLSRDEIPLGARVTAVADAYDAIVTPRPYRPALAPQAALAEIRRAAGRQFDPGIVDVFVPLMETRLASARDHQTA